MAKSDGRRFGLIVIGDEILSGRRQDKHLAKMIELLSERGLSLSWARYLADDPEQIIDTLKQSFASGDVVFSTQKLWQIDLSQALHFYESRRGAHPSPP
jgi:molybdopterin biosynthesis enzyme MoaB